MNHMTREQEMALIGAAVMGNAARMFGGRMPTKRQLMKRQIVEKAKRLIRTSDRTEKPEEMLKSLIKAGLGKIVRRRNNPPLFVPIVAKNIR